MMTSSLLPTAATISRDVVEHPGLLRQLMRVHRPVEPKSVVARHGDEAGARGLLLVGRDRVLEVAEHDVDLSGDVLDLGADLLVVRRHEMDHALEPHRQARDRAPARRWRAANRTSRACGWRPSRWNSRVAVQRTLLGGLHVSTRGDAEARWRDRQCADRDGLRRQVLTGSKAATMARRLAMNALARAAGKASTSASSMRSTIGSDAFSTSLPASVSDTA